MDNYIIFIGKDFQGVAPAEIQVIPAGRTITPKGVFVLDQESAQAVISDFEAHKNDMVIDYEHQTLSDPPVEAPAGGRVATGRGTDVGLGRAVGSAPCSAGGKGWSATLPESPESFPPPPRSIDPPPQTTSSSTRTSIMIGLRPLPPMSGPRGDPDEPVGGR